MKKIKKELTKRDDTYYNAYCNEQENIIHPWECKFERKTRFRKVEKIMKKETILVIGEAVVNVAAELLKNKIEKSAEGKQ